VRLRYLIIALLGISLAFGSGKLASKAVSWATTKKADLAWAPVEPESRHTIEARFPMIVAENGTAVVLVGRGVSGQPGAADEVHVVCPRCWNCGNASLLRLCGVCDTTEQKCWTCGYRIGNERCDRCRAAVQRMRSEGGAR
jgi:hypothetical protein